MSPPRPGVPRRQGAVLLSAALLAAACGGGGLSGPPPTSPAAPAASDAEWRALATPRPTPVTGAARVRLGEVQILGDVGWRLPAGLEAPLALQELVTAGLLRRRDVVYVEGRRFAEAAEAERLGTPRPAGAPPAGVSPGPDFLATAVWSPVLGTGRLDVRLVDPGSGAVVATHQGTAPMDGDPTAVARTLVSGLLAALEAVGRRPDWTDPVAEAGGVPAAATEAFFRGLVAEDRWDWEDARVAYEAAVDLGGRSFPEAAAALARAARLRNGGTLGVG